MRDNDIYEYAIIRLVPVVERGEYINIGVILLAKHKNYLAMQYYVDADRINAIAPDIDIQLIERYLQSWDKVCQGGTDGGPIGALDIRVRFRWLTASRSTIIQSSPVHPGRASEPMIALQDMFDKYVTQ